MSISETKKRKHHFVWRFYLESWADDRDLTWSLRDGKIYKPNIRDVAQKRDFYKPRPLGSDEVKLAELFINRFPAHLREFHEDTLSLFKLAQLAQTVIVESGDANPELAKLLEAQIHNLEEDLHGGVEGNSIQYIEALLAEDIGFWDQINSRGEFLVFLCTQYMRTQKIQDKLFQSIFEERSDDKRMENIWGMMRHILPLNIASSILADENYQIILLMNDTATPFITGDQPVINTLTVGDDTAGIGVAAVEFYYPVSPRKAVIVTSRMDHFGSKELFVSPQDVTRYNSLILKGAHESIFSNSRALLEALLN